MTKKTTAYRVGPGKPPMESRFKKGHRETRAASPGR